jgi:DNA-binding beta-propeller fold protein YncE
VKVVALSFALLVACGDDAEPPEDGSTADAALDADAAPDTTTPGPLAVSLSGDPAAWVGQEYCLTAVHNGGPEARFAFVWGDDGPEEDVRAESCHTFDFPGEQLVSVVVLDREMRAEASRIVPVVFQPAELPPTHSSSIVYDAVRDRVWVVNPDADTVSVLAADPPAQLAEVPVGDRPRTVALVGSTVVVACQEDDTLHLLDADDFSSREVVDVGYGSAPYGVAADPRGGRVWVSRLQAADLVSVDVPSGVVRREIDLGPDPRGVAVSGDGAIFVTRWRSDVSAAYVYHVDARDPATATLVGTTILPRQEGLDSDTDNDGVASFLNQVVFSPDAGRAILPSLKANVVAGLYNTGAELTSQTTARAVMSEIMRDPDDPVMLARDSFRFAFDDLDFASAVVFSPLGERAYVAFQGAERVIAVDAFSFNATGSIREAGAAPQGLAISPDGRRLFVQAFLDRQVRVYDVSDLSTEPDPIAVVDTVATEPLDPTVLEGKRIFYRSRDPRMSRTSYLSCASCHLDGEGDNLVWDFTQRGEGLRNTIPLRGRGGVAHGALHWSANFDEVQDFEHDIRNGQGGTGFMSDADFTTGTRGTPLGDPKAGVSVELDALAAYLASLSSFGRSPFRREGDATWEAAYARGEAIFQRPATGCASCHAGSVFTDSGFDGGGAPTLHDVGTLDTGSGQRLSGPLTGLDTPTLRGLWRSAPYFHDGSAASIRDVLTIRNPSDAHGVTSTLSSAEIDDLVVYLRALDDRAP